MDRRPVVCRNLAMGFWVPLQHCHSLSIMSKSSVNAALVFNHAVEHPT